MKQYNFNKTRLQEQPRDYYRKLSEEEKQGGKKGYAKIRYKEMFDEINKKEKKI